MRDIKFRGKDKDNNWVFGDLLHGVGEKAWDVYILPVKHNLAGIPNCDPLDGVEVDEDTVGQYTGLKDKNGKEIYEGDILKTDLERDYLIAVFRNGAFMFDCFDKKHYYDIMLPVDSESTCVCEEIIGNIYDNSELLKESEETK
jgi:uncharacterized phage protein (TIGR01671 family)